ncbi:MAG: restriction endonuclease subunit S [Pseudomonadota bacterium]
MNGGTFDPNQYKVLPEDTEPLEELEAKDGDILMYRAGGSLHYIGSVAMAHEPPARLIFSDKNYRVTPDASVMDRAFFAYGMAAKALRDQIVLSVSGAEGLANNIAQASVKEYLFAVPPISEQEKIGEFLSIALSKIENVAVRCEKSIEKLTEYRAALVTAAVTGKIKALLAEDAPTPAKKEAPAAFKRSVLATYIADTLCDHPTFGRVKFQKLLHLCEEHPEIQEVAGNYHRDAAGPFDTQMMRSVHSQITKPGWIVTSKRDGGKGTLYRRGENVDGYRDYFVRYFANRKVAIDDLLALLKAADTQQAEIVSTAFAARNDLLLEGKTPSDDEIVDLILNDWAESKKAISPDRWHSAVAWMREKGFTPRGLGEHTKLKS